MSDCKYRTLLSTQTHVVSSMTQCNNNNNNHWHLKISAEAWRLSQNNTFTRTRQSNRSQTAVTCQGWGVKKKKEVWSSCSLFDSCDLNFFSPRWPHWLLTSADLKSKANALMRQKKAQRVRTLAGFTEGCEIQGRCNWVCKLGICLGAQPGSPPSPPKMAGWQHGTPLSSLMAAF